MDFKFLLATQLECEAVIRLYCELTAYSRYRARICPKHPATYAMVAAPPAD